MVILGRYYQIPMCTRPRVFVYHQFETFRAVKLKQYIGDNLNLKGLHFFGTPYRSSKNYSSFCRFHQEYGTKI